jgi:hypothetical protein
VGKTVSVKRAVQALLAAGVEPLRIVRVSVDGWQANRLGMLYNHVVRVLTSAVGARPRYWFIDEVTTCRGDWWSVVKDLRDNTPFGDDCAVLTGSSSAGLDNAVKALAGRRGPVAGPDRALLPMHFADFCRCLSVDLPAVAGLRPDELMSGRARQTWLDLAPYTDDLVAAWQAYLEVGGYPKAVGDWRRGNQVAASTWQALWDVTRGDAITSGTSEAVLGALLEGISRRLTSLFAESGLAREVGIARSAVEGRLRALAGAFVVWRCPRADDQGRPDLRKQAKVYFLDPLVARLPELVQGSPQVDITHLSEQQLGVALLQWNERARPGAARAGYFVTHHRGAGGSEVDFAGTVADTLARAVPLEGKYASDGWRREALSLRRSALAHGVLATRDVLDVADGEPVWAVPAPFVALALSLP